VSGQVRVYHADRLGSVRWVTDGSGNLVASYVYEGFGKIVGQSGGGGGPYQFCGLWGYRNDQDAGLLHVGARYYEVETGRFIQKDYWLDLNRYSYVKNNPIELIDPDGLKPKRRKKPKPIEKEKSKPGEVSLEVQKGPITIGIKKEIDIGPFYAGYDPSSRSVHIGIELGPFYGHYNITIPSWEDIKKGLLELLRQTGMWGTPLGSHYQYMYLYNRDRVN
jgi:RHS repeat-associated protein